MRSDAAKARRRWAGATRAARTGRAARGATARGGASCVVVVGRRRANAVALLRVLLGGAVEPPAVPAGAHLVLYGPGRSAMVAAVPGRYRAHPYPARLPRPPRRVEVGVADTLFAQLRMVVTPGLDVGGAAVAHVIEGLIERGAALLLVVDDAEPLGDAELLLLAMGVAYGRPVFLAVTAPAGGGGPPDRQRWPDVVGRNQSLLARQVPELVLSPWYVLACPSASDASDASGRRSAPGGWSAPGGCSAAGAGAADLRRDLSGWAGDQRARRAAASRLRRAARPVPIGEHSSDCGWERVLGRAVDTNRQRTGQRVSIEVARSHLRCAQVVAEHGCAALPEAFDAELHGLSAVATMAVQEGVLDIVTATLSQVLERVPEAGVLRRTVLAVRRQLAEAAGTDAGGEVDVMAGPGGGSGTGPGSGPAAGSGAERALLVLTTGDLAEVVGAGALWGMSAFGVSAGPAGPAGGPPGVLPLATSAVGLGLTAGCFPQWTCQGADSRNCLRWLHRAVRGVDRALQQEIATRFADVQVAMTSLVAAGMTDGALPI